ncbi:MAG: ribonuclease HII [Bacillaceae bacterium]
MARTIKEIQQLIQDNCLSEQVLEELRGDSRKGVQTLLKKWEKKQEDERKTKAKFMEMSKYETQLWNKGIQFIAGVDEVGRGPLAGPVVAGAVILPTDFYLPGINDSKKLSERKRDAFYDYIIEHCISYGIGIVEAKEIDQINIYEATKVAMQKAISQLNVKAEYLLIDAMTLPIEIGQQSIIKGDANSISIAAASIVAKVTRDRMMKELGKKHPNYGFEKHMGYGTKEHLEAIYEFGILDEHRKSFAPIKDTGK